MPIDSMFNYQLSNINLMLFNEINNFIEENNNSVIELIQCFGTSFFGRLESPRKLGDQIMTKELGPKTLHLFNNLKLLTSV